MSKMKTPNDGAADERRLWIRKINSMLRILTPNEPAYSYLITLKEYGQGRTNRNNARPGGQGRK